MSELLGVQDAIRVLDDHSRHNKLAGYEPYPFQLMYHRCVDASGANARQTLLSAGNQSGKSECGGADVAFHATGEYPDWWPADAPRLDRILAKYPEIWCGDQNNDTVRDHAQSRLLGKASDPTAWGTGWLPADRILSWSRKANVPDAIESVTVQHRQGFTVTIRFKAYEADRLDWAGTPVALIWLDEEPPQYIYSQCVARTIASDGMVKMTFTPERGATDLVTAFWKNLQPGQCFIMAGWEDAAHEDGRSHLSREKTQALLNSWLPHEREMRSRGVPVLGAGLVFPVPEEAIVIPWFEIPPHWPRLGGLDFGSGGENHPTAAVVMAFDRDADMGYVTHALKSRAVELASNAAAIKGLGGGGVPFAWPHDGRRKEAYATEGIANEYRQHGVNLLRDHFVNPDDGTNAVEPGILSMLVAMQEGRFKVFDHLHEWLQERRLYHRSEKDNSIIRANDDLMSATRICWQSRSHAALPADLVERRRPAVIDGTGEF